MLGKERWKLYGMKSSFEIDTNQSIARVKLHGELVVDEFVASYEELLLHPQFLPKMSVIWDARDAFAEASMAKVQISPPQR